MNDLLLSLRHNLHQHPELSDEEFDTAERITQFFAPLTPDHTVKHIGGTGIAFIFNGQTPGPSVLFRCELDALPIEETNTFAYRSTRDGVSHKCGHDGHMAIIAGLGLKLAANRPKKGRVILLFQPAEETGAGAGNVVDDAQFADLKPDYAFALHNLPGEPLGQVIVRDGCFNCASRGIQIELIGKTSHAAHPEDGTSPAEAMREIMVMLEQLPQQFPQTDELVMSTLVHARLGEAAFGTAPGYAEVLSTLRAESDETIQTLADLACEKAQEISAKHRLEHRIHWHDVFAASVNHPEAAQCIANAAKTVGIIPLWRDEPYRWSEDFGLLSATCKGAMFALGAGEHSPQLHNPDYDFPDTLIDTGTRVFYQIVDDLLSV